MAASGKYQAPLQSGDVLFNVGDLRCPIGSKADVESVELHAPDDRGARPFTAVIRLRGRIPDRFTLVGYTLSDGWALISASRATGAAR